MSSFRNGFALVIGIANYPNLRKLPQAVLNDAQDIKQLLCSPYHCSYPETHLQLLLDKQATAHGLRDGLRWLADVTGIGDTAVIFFSGHGARVESGPQAGHYLIPYDCNPHALNTTAISGTELSTALRHIRAQRLLVFFDSCYAAGTGEPKSAGLAQGRFKAGLDERYYERLAVGTGRAIIASSRSDEESLVLPGMKNSLFTHFLLEALRGHAHSNDDGLLRIFDVFDYVANVVPAHGPQHPVFKASELESNFPIALYLGGKQGEPTAGTGVPSSIRQIDSVDKGTLRAIIIQGFNLEELDLLCADLQQILADNGVKLPVSIELVGGNGKPQKVLNLIEYLDRRGYLPYLARLVAGMRSNYA